jgi:hypothetical protein
MKRTAFLLLTLALFGFSGAARAEGPAVPEGSSRVIDAGPNGLLLATGAATFAFAYGGSLWVGATRSSDRPLLVPFAGPWIALGAHGACGGGGAPCGQETTYAALFVADGLAQAAGAVQIALAFLLRDLRDTHDPLVRSARITVAPSRPAGGGVGIAAFGEF